MSSSIPSSGGQVAAHAQHEEAGAVRVLTLSTVAFTLLFAVWLMFGVLGVPIKSEFGIADCPRDVGTLGGLGGFPMPLGFGYLETRTSERT